MGTTPDGLPMADCNGVRSVTGARWAQPAVSNGGYDGDTLSGVVIKAIEQKIVSRQEIKEATNV